jgi:flagella basal body P-ring formation protein FlgA
MAGVLPLWESAQQLRQLAQRTARLPALGVAQATAPTTQGWLRHCSQPSARITTETRWMQTIAISCKNPFWQVYIPVSIHLKEPVAVAEHFLPPGVVIEKGMVKMSLHDVGPEDAAVATSITEVIGRVVDAGVLGGSVINPVYLSAPTVIRQGQRVVMKAQSGSVTVKMPGIALDDAKVGGKILVRNNSSQTVVTGVVSANGTVLVSPGEG